MSLLALFFVSVAPRSLIWGPVLNGTRGQFQECVGRMPCAHWLLSGAKPSQVRQLSSHWVALLAWPGLVVLRALLFLCLPGPLLLPLTSPSHIHSGSLASPLGLVDMVPPQHGDHRACVPGFAPCLFCSFVCGYFKTFSNYAAATAVCPPRLIGM